MLNKKLYESRINDNEILNKINQCYELIKSSIDYKNRELSLRLKNEENILNLIDVASRDKCWRLNIITPNIELIIKMIKMEN